MASSERSPPQNPKKLQQQEEEDEVLWSEECKQLLLCLPKQQGWGNWPYLYHFQGFWFTSRQLQGTLNCLSHFQFLPSDVLLVTFPKSRTTWLKSLLFCIVNRHVYPANATSDHPLTTHNPHDLVPFIERNLYVQEEEDNNHHSQGSSIRLLSTHVPVTCLPSSVTDSGCKVVHLWRDPRDTFVSLWHFINTGGGHAAAPLDEVFDKFCDGVSVYGPMWDHVLGYWRESLKRPSHVLFLKFEELMADPAVGVKRLAEFLRCPFMEDEDGGGVVDRIVGMCSFGHLSNLDVNRNGRRNDTWPNKAFFRRGEVGDWANYLTPEMSDRLMKIVDAKLHGCGLILDI